MWLFDGYEPGQFQIFTNFLESDVANFGYLDSANPAAGGDARISSWWADLHPRGEALTGHEIAEDHLPDQSRRTANDWFFEGDEGGDFSTLDNTPDGGVIVVTGKRSSDSSGIAWVEFGGAGDGNGAQPRTVSEDGGSGEPLADEDVVEITINITNLTAEQKADVKALQEAIDRADRAINALADDARVQLPNGSIVTGQELKALWAKTDFVINPESWPYQNGTTRGESNYNYGDPVVSLNIDVIDDYHSLPDLGIAGLNYLVLHELGHLTLANRDFDADPVNPQYLVEQMANDIARAIANNGLLSILPGSGDYAPGGGYSTDAPLNFTL